jgi:predicted metal-binding membrane protein
MANVESRRAAAPAMVLAGTLGLAAACWAAAAWLMRGMDMGLATRPGSFGFFAAAWVTMMAAMMLPGAAPAVARQARVTGTMRAAALFTGAYLAIWALAGLVAEAAAREGRHRRSARAGAHRARTRSGHRALADSRAHASSDVTTRNTKEGDRQ